MEEWILNKKIMRNRNGISFFKLPQNKHQKGMVQSNSPQISTFDFFPILPAIKNNYKMCIVFISNFCSKYDEKMKKSNLRWIIRSVQITMQFYGKKNPSCSHD